MNRKNKKGNVYFNIGLGVFIFIMGVMFLPYITDDITTTRALLDCVNPDDITSGTMLTCIGISGLVPYFIWFFISIAIGFIIGGQE